jgi:hypothetical protein
MNYDSEIWIANPKINIELSEGYVVQLRIVSTIVLFIVLAHRNNRPRIDLSPHSDTLAWFRANLLINATCLEEKQHIVFGFIRSGLESTIYHTQGEHANHYTTDWVKINIESIAFHKQIQSMIWNRGGSSGRRTRRAPPKIGKNMIFLSKIVIFHTKYPNNFRTSPRSAQFF